MTLFKQPIKEQVLRLLKLGWYSTNEIVQIIGAQSADRRTRDLREEGYKILERKRSDGIIVRHIED